MDGRASETGKSGVDRDWIVDVIGGKYVEFSGVGYGEEQGEPWKGARCVLDPHPPNSGRRHQFPCNFFHRFTIRTEEPLMIK